MAEAEPVSSGNGAEHAFELVTSLGFAGFVLLLLAMPMALGGVQPVRAVLVRLLVAVANLCSRLS